MSPSRPLRFLLALVPLAVAPVVHADADRDALAKSLSNPVAALISVPFQFNVDAGYGADRHGTRTTLNLQPVVPVSIGEDWNLISRTILPVLTQHGVSAPGTTESGLGDIVQSVFLSPKAPTASGWIWGAGPVFLLPSGRTGFSAGQWAAGPTAVVLKQQNGYTFGALANHLWGLSGHGSLPATGLPDLNATFVQPFVSKSLGRGATLAANLESTYDWNRSAWTVPLNVSYSQVLPVGHQLVSLGGGVRGYLASPTGGPDWGLRLTVTLLYPR
jgi:hypothetical protein